MVLLDSAGEGCSCMLCKMLMMFPCAGLPSAPPLRVTEGHIYDINDTEGKTAFVRLFLPLLSHKKAI